jgi:uncharacterized protein YdhG (YjbR/CyaY superfamily)
MPVTTPAAYLAAQPAAARKLLASARAAIVKAVPGVKQAIKYGMIAFTLPGGTVLYLAGWKKHYSLYPAYASITRALADELADVDVEANTIRFSYTAAAPLRLITKIAKLRAAEVRAKQPR